MISRNLTLLSHAVTRTAQRQGFLAHVFAHYQLMESVDEGKLAELLGCSLDDYYRIALCRTPVTESLFLKQVKQIAEYGNASVTKLALIIRRVEAAKAFHNSHIDPGNVALLAAREREESEDGNGDA